MLQALKTPRSRKSLWYWLNQLGMKILNCLRLIYLQSGSRKGKDNNGLLILFVEDQRAIRFETGYGIEGFTGCIGLPHPGSKHVPSFKAGNYDEGFIKGIEHVVSVLGEEKFEEAKKKLRGA